jgi:hypothetical protein
MAAKFFHFFCRKTYLVLPIPTSNIIKVIRKRTIKTKKINLAIPAAAAEIPVKPNKAATREIIKNITTHLNIA